MASDPATVSFGPTHIGSYDLTGSFDPYSITSAGSDGTIGYVAFETFDAAAIESQAANDQAMGWVVHLDLDYTVQSSDPDAHDFNVNGGFYSSIGYQTTVEAGRTDHSGYGGGQDAYVYQDLTGTGETNAFSRKTSFAGVGYFGDGTETASYSSDITGAVEQAAGAGRDLVFTLNENESGGSDGLESMSIVLTATKGANPPTIAGTRSGQPVVAGASDQPFSTVTLGDSANPGGAGDDIAITILNPQGNGTDAFGVLTGAGLTSYGNGQYELVPAQSSTTQSSTAQSSTAQSLTALQAELDALVFTTSAGAAGSTAVFELDLQSAAGSAADDQTTSVVIEQACFAAGTMIATPDGEIAVDAIRAGDTVMTRAGPRPVSWTGRRSVDVRASRDPEAALLVRIRAGAFGDGVPHRDLLVTQEHCLLCDGVLVPARMLVNERSILLDRDRLRYDYHHVELERHGILFAERLGTESYLDTGNRRAFEGPVQDLHPDRAMPEPRSWAEAAAPLRVDREAVEPIWRGLDARADRLGLPPRASSGGGDDDPELRLLLEDGSRLAPVLRAGGLHGFHLPRGARAVRLLSRSARPADSIGPFVDDRRRLGVAVGRLVLWRGLDATVIPAGSIALPGWHALEGGTRWTDGAAALDLPVADAGTMLDVHVEATMGYGRAGSECQAA